MNEIFARLRHDSSPRQYKNLTLVPETVPFQSSPWSKGKGKRIPVFDVWQHFCRDINSPKAFKWLFTPYTAWINEEWNLGNNPMAEPISFGGNFLKLIRHEGHFYQVEAIPYTQQPSTKLSFKYTPWLVHKVVCITRTGQLRKPGYGLDVYFPLLVNGEHWIDEAKVELLPPLPMKVFAKDIVNIRQWAGITYPIVGKLYPGDAIIVNQYILLGHDIWAASSKGFVALEFAGYYPFQNWLLTTCSTLA